MSVSDRFPTGSAFVRYRPDGGRDFVYNIAESAAGQIRLTPEARRLADDAGAAAELRHLVDEDSRRAARIG
ncbi:MAG: hypothetical protein E5V40_24395, partial [Mesorhizobium sp.]